VVEVTYYGDRFECAIRIDDAGEQYVIVDADKRQSAREGDRVLLAIDASRVMLWPS